ncbi:MAG TPA: hypothetical protein VH601_16715 [Bryobacteraceae bacterium]|jgi:hypothetical protein
MALRAVPDHPKFYRLKRLLGSKVLALGSLEAIWHFCGRFTPRGNIGKYSDEEIEDWVEWTGERGALIQVLVESRWLDIDPIHRLIVHDWSQHADEATKKALVRAHLAFVSTVSRQDRDMSRPPEPEPEPEPAAVANVTIVGASVYAPSLPPPPADFSQARETLRQFFPASDDAMGNAIVAAAVSARPGLGDAELAKR